MAYITQYDIDMKEQARNDAQQGQFINNIGSLMSGIESNRRRAIDEKRAGFQEDLALSKMGATPDEIKTYKETGAADSIFAKYSAAAEAAKAKALQDADLDRKVKESQINKNNYRAPVKADPVDIYKQKLALKDEQEKSKKEDTGELEVPGYGIVRSKEEAKTIRTAKGDVETAKGYINEIKALGKDVQIWDREKIGKINQLKQALVGKLRLPLMGPGTMTEDEFQRTVSNLGDPGTLFGTEANEMGKLDQMSSILDNNIKAMYSAAAKDSPYQQASAASQIAPHIQQKIQSYTPEQKAARLQELKNRQPPTSAMVGR